MPITVVCPHSRVRWIRYEARRIPGRMKHARYPPTIEVRELEAKQPQSQGKLSTLVSEVNEGKLLLHPHTRSEQGTYIELAVPCRQHGLADSDKLPDRFVVRKFPETSWQRLREVLVRPFVVRHVSERAGAESKDKSGAHLSEFSGLKTLGLRAGPQGRFLPIGQNKSACAVAEADLSEASNMTNARRS